MDNALDLTGYAYALGRAEAAWRFAGAELRRTAALATISNAWDIFRREAGAGDVGRAHKTAPAASLLLVTEDPRRDPVLLWLADHGVLDIAKAATTVARMVGATRRFGAEEQALLGAAQDALANPPALGPVARVISGGGGSETPVLEPLLAIAGAVDRLRNDVGFRESEGANVYHALPRGTLSHHVSAEPGGCWALNLALVGRGAQSVGTLPPPGLMSRILFRGELDAEETASHLVDGARLAWSDAYNQLVRLEPQLERGRDALAHLSRNARTSGAWLLVVALSTCTRNQLARALGLSRAGADIQANALADAGLVTLGAGGLIRWREFSASTDLAPAPIDQSRLAIAVSDLDAKMAEIDRLLARRTK